MQLLPAHMDVTAAPISGKYLRLTSFRDDGTGVSTPVWFVEDEGHLLVAVDAESGDVERILHNPMVTVAPCTARGRGAGAALIARAEVLEEDETHRIEELLARKYRVDTAMLKPLRVLNSALRRGGRPVHAVVIAITDVGSVA